MRPVALLTSVCLACCLAAAPDGGPSGPTSARDAVRAVVEATAAGTVAVQPDRPLPDEATGWIKANTEAFDGVRPGPLKDLPWGYSTFRPASAGKPARLYLHVFDWHASGKLIAYGLSPEGVRRAHLLSGPNSHLPVSHTDRAVIVTVPNQPPDPIATVVVLEFGGEPKTVPLAVRPRPDGSVVLHARDAIVHGKTVRYEPEPHKDTVGYWMDPSDWVRWEFEVTQPGRYDVVILQGCGKGHGGSTVHFSAAGQTLPVTVEDTGGFQNFVRRPIGSFTFEKPGRHTLTVKPQRKASVAVMDLRQVTLTPVRQP